MKNGDGFAVPISNKLDLSVIIKFPLYKSIAKWYNTDIDLLE
jgi:hypothetical protein